MKAISKKLTALFVVCLMLASVMPIFAMGDVSDGLSLSSALGPLVRLTLTPDSIELEPGEAKSLAPTVQGLSGITADDCQWSSSNTAVATVAGGVVTGVKEGAANITCRYASGSNSVQATATVTVAGMALADAGNPTTECSWTINHYQVGTSDPALAPPDTGTAPQGETIALADYIKTDITGFTYNSCDNDMIVSTSDNTANIYYLSSVSQSSPGNPVTYTYIGTVPPGAPNPPNPANYVAGETVTVAPDVTPPSQYTFSGWSTTNATVNNNEFIMPDQPVSFTGSFTYVGYTITYMPNGMGTLTGADASGNVVYTGATTDQRVTYGRAIPAVRATNADYYFAHQWQLAGTNNVYTPSQIAAMQVTGNMTFLAVYEQKGIITLYLEPDTVEFNGTEQVSSKMPTLSYSTDDLNLSGLTYDNLVANESVVYRAARGTDVATVAPGYQASITTKDYVSLINGGVYKVVSGTDLSQPMLIITPRPVTLRVSSEVKPYDGLPLYATVSMDPGGLVAGDTFKPENVILNGNGRINAGSNPVTVDPSSTKYIVNDYDVDQKSNYNVTFVHGSVTIIAPSTPAPTNTPTPTPTNTPTPTTHYTILYYFDGVPGNDATESYTRKVGTTVYSYPGKAHAGMRLESVEGLPLKLSSNADNNVIRVYYVTRDSYTLITDLNMPLAGSFMNTTVGDTLE